ncbi:MAG: NAD(P)H-dependent oxidoreductase [Phycisphaerae bacterium]|jgi:nitroreductase|nr:MAG: NAD(P)H-dependent oxidoreductase [Phycisphaerae bacterium]
MTECSLNEFLLERLNWRYATQKFDPTRKIPTETWATLEQALVLTASGFGLQPWRFVVVTEPSVRQQLVSASYGQKQVQEASHVVVFGIPRRLDATHVRRHVMRMMETRNTPTERLERYEKVTCSYLESLSTDQKTQWMARQVYLALGAFLTSAAVLGVDTCPMEGFIPQEYDRLLGLQEQDLQSVVVCCAGYRDSSDKYATQAKVRFKIDEVIVRI